MYGREGCAFKISLYKEKFENLWQAVLNRMGGIRSTHEGSLTYGCRNCQLSVEYRKIMYGPIEAPYCLSSRQGWTDAKTGTPLIDRAYVCNLMISSDFMCGDFILALTCMHQVFPSFFAIRSAAPLLDGLNTILQPSFLK